MVTKRALCLAVAVGFCLGLMVFPVWAEVKVGDNLGNLQFSKLLEPADQKYLGLSGAGPFSLSQINASYVLVEAFATTCPHCMVQAPIMNNAYSKISQDPGLSGKLKFIALGGGDNDSAVTMWRKQFKIPFPVLADPDSATSKKLNIPGTPSTIVMDKTGKVVFVEIGAFESADEFVKQLKAKLK